MKDSRMSLTEATQLALLGKLKLEEDIEVEQDDVEVSVNKDKVEIETSDGKVTVEPTQTIAPETSDDVTTAECDNCDDTAVSPEMDEPVDISVETNEDEVNTDVTTDSDDDEIDMSEEIKEECNNILKTKITEAETSDSEEITIPGLTSYKNLASQFRNYRAYEANFKPLVIVKINRQYYIYKADAESSNDYIDFTDNKEYIEGWMHGAIKAKNKIMENKLQEVKDVADYDSDIKDITEYIDSFDDTKLATHEAQAVLMNTQNFVEKEAEKYRARFTESKITEDVEDDEEMEEEHNHNLKLIDDYLEEISNLIYTAYNTISFGGDYENFLRDLYQLVVKKMNESGYSFPEIAGNNKVTEKFSSKSFENKFENFLKSKYKAVESFKITRVLKGNKGLKIECKISTIDKKSKNVSFDLNKINEGKIFSKYALNNNSGLKLENKQKLSDTIVTTKINKNILECADISLKSKLK